MITFFEYFKDFHVEKCNKNILCDSSNNPDSLSPHSSLSHLFLLATVYKGDRNSETHLIDEKIQKYYRAWLWSQN